MLGVYIGAAHNKDRKRLLGFTQDDIRFLLNTRVEADNETMNTLWVPGRKEGGENNGQRASSNNAFMGYAIHRVWSGLAIA